MELDFDTAFRKLYSSLVDFCEHIYGGVNVFDAEEIASSAFDVLSKKWKSLESHERVVLWVFLCRVTKFKTADFLKLQKPRPVSLDDAIHDLSLSVMEEMTAQSEDEIAETLMNYIQRIKIFLSEKEWELFEMVVLEKYAFRKISEELQVSEAAAKMRWYRLQTKLYPYVMKMIKEN